MRTIWLASYPKSGNTWLRMLVANLSATNDCPVDINDLPERGGMASGREPFDTLLLIESGVLTHDECDRLRPLLHAARARFAGVDDEDLENSDAPDDVRFVKTHDAYTLTPAGEPLLAGARGAHGAILIVRDPRDVAPSLANHNNSSIDDAIAFMSDPLACFSGNPGRQHNQLRQQLPTWSGFNESWLSQTDIPVHLVRYEDLAADPVRTFRAALEFAGREATAEQVERAVRFADFGNLQRQEREKGFREGPRPYVDGQFFRRGEAGAWRDELTAEQVALIEAAHEPMMRRLGYALANDERRLQACH